VGMLFVFVSELLHVGAGRPGHWRGTRGRN